MTNYDKLIATLEEIFMLDKAELDFGIYRIMNQKREDITKFLKHDLVPQVKQVLTENLSVDKQVIQKKIDDVIEASKVSGHDPETSPVVQQLRAKLGEAADLGGLENEVFSLLTNFFKRYFDNGDFISMRRYKRDVYAIPYEGEEVKLHWANADQYYIKTSEYFKNYSFKLSDEKKVTFELVEASTEQNNNKVQKDKIRRFKLYEDKPLEVLEDELKLYFTYEPADKKVKQDGLLSKAFDTLTPHIPADFTELLTLKPTKADKKRTLLQKHLQDYTARNTFDYFIHKDLGGFLTRELDFYIKNEVLFIDDLNTRDEQEFLKQLSQIKAIKKIGEKIIAFLAQLENFQKKLWLKKKFVVETNYCITLDRVPEELYPEIAQNEAQIQEWIKLFAIDKIKEQKASSLFTEDRVGFAIPLSVDFLKQNPYFVLDTAFFSETFKWNLISNIEKFDEQCDGLLINSENFQALEVLKDRFKEKVKCLYLDPPYNTGADDFIYKDDYQHSSWLSMMSDRLLQSTSFIKPEGTIAISIDLKEVDKTIALLDTIYGEENRKSSITVKRGSVTGAKVINPGVVNVSEYVIAYSSDEKYWSPEKAFREKGYDSRYGTMIKNIEAPFENWQFESVLDAFAKEKQIKKSKLKKELGEDYDTELLSFVIRNASKVIRLASLDENSISSDAIELKNQSKSNPDKIYHLEREDRNDYYILNGNAILFYKDRLIDIGGRLVPGEPVSDIWDDVLPNDLHNEGGVSLRKGKKPERLIHRIVEMSSKRGELVMDFFAGSATSCAVAQKSNRKWIGVEQGSYFDQITLKRMKNTLYGDKSGVTNDTKWQGGGFFKYIRLESYEDTLNNLQLNLTDQQQQALEINPSFKEGYTLNYMLDVETQDSLLNLKWFENPFDCKLDVTRNNGKRPTKVDLVETFNYLIGLIVESYAAPKDGYVVITGKSLTGEKILVVWRDCTKHDNKALNDFLKKSHYNPLDSEFDRIYVNGDNNVENLKAGDERWKVVLIEEEFKKRMFENA
ncbi:site-specific DNA-methyltransferase [Pontibacter sp. HSC-14F20]|uniref:DNA methyltransferase n=1 Tax=Pontibacter sp. HSC-14F20 TaxID=2864136 RepID=UPI001C733F2A|nr:site-specific DNA-methyltransferase [Pontibacter sp. HSC-14F20]MBX0332965.1 site-specific DNA-methyltransferase [Pontibacter sp. HSC-14F20]